MDKRRMCPHCRAFINADDKVCPYCDARVGPRAADLRSPGKMLGGLISPEHFATVVILTVNFGLFLATMVFSMRSGNDNAIMGLDGSTLYLFGAKQTAAILGRHQYWRLITAGFLHGGLIHIGMNSWVLFDLGAQLEQVYGTSRMWVIYLASTITGFLLSCFWANTLSIGASAGLFGLIGGAIALGVRYPSSYGHLVRVMLKWVLIMLVLGFLGIFAIDNAAHIGGLAGGFLVGYVAGTPGLFVDSPTERAWNWAALAGIALTVLSFVEVFLNFNFNA